VNTNEVLHSGLRLMKTNEVLHCGFRLVNTNEVLHGGYLDNEDQLCSTLWITFNEDQ
jgi:hypothetical protein